jgi:hypothetical protein
MPPVRGSGEKRGEGESTMILTDWTTPVYLGDGLYVDFDGFQIRLFASDGINHTNTVYLEPSVIAAFLNYVKDLRDTFAVRNGEQSNVPD